MSPHGERRRHPRVTPFDCQGGIRGRIRPGHDVLVIDLSEGGALVETSKRLTPGATAEIQVDAPDGRHTTRGVVVRSYVCALLAELVLFRAALALERPVPWLREYALVGEWDPAVGAAARSAAPRTGLWPRVVARP